MKLVLKALKLKVATKRMVSTSWGLIVQCPYTADPDAAAPSTSSASTASAALL